MPLSTVPQQQEVQQDSSDEDDVPLSTVPQQQEVQQDSSDEDDVPLSTVPQQQEVQQDRPVTMKMCLACSGPLVVHSDTTAWWLHQQEPGASRGRQ